MSSPSENITELRRRNVRAHERAQRRAAAKRRGRSTPSPERPARPYSSNDSENPDNEKMERLVITPELVEQTRKSHARVMEMIKKRREEDARLQARAVQGEAPLDVEDATREQVDQKHSHQLILNPVTELRRRNVRVHEKAQRRAAAKLRGRSTPSPERPARPYSSNDSENPDNESMQRPMITAEWEERHARNVEKLQKRREEYAKLRSAAQATPAQGETPLEDTEPTREQDAHQRSDQPTWNQPNNPPEQTVPQPVITADERPSVGEGAGVSTPAGEPADSHNRQPGDGVRDSFNGEPADADQLYEDRAAEAEILLNSVSSGSLRQGMRRERIGFEKAVEEARKKAAATRNIPERPSRDENPEVEHTQNPVPQLPGDFPAFHCTHRMNDIGAYLANASYVLSICGPPVAELNYGIIIYPAGEERMIFGQGPYFSMDQEFYDRIADANSAYSEVLRMHDPEKDSDEFARHRFDDQFTELSFKDFHNVEQLGPSGYAGAVPLPTSPTSRAGPSSNQRKNKGEGRAPVLKKPPEQAKGQRRSPRISMKIQQQEYLEMNEKIDGEKVNKRIGNAHVGATKRRRKV